MRRVLVHVQRQLSVIEAQEDIKSKVQEELGDRQREMLLREQLKAIQKELGDGEGGSEIDELREKLDKLTLPADVRKEVDRELGRLSRMGREAMETQVIRTYLETIAELPWNSYSLEHLDIPVAAEILDTDHYALGDVKDRVLEFLAVRQLRRGRGERPQGDGGGRDGRGRRDRRSPRRGPRRRPAAAAGARGEGSEAGRRGRARPPPGRGAEGQGAILLFVGPPGVGKPRSPSRSRGPWGASTSASRSAACATRSRSRPSPHLRRRHARPDHPGHSPGRSDKLNPGAACSIRSTKLGASCQRRPGERPSLRCLTRRRTTPSLINYLGVPFDLSRGDVHRHRELAIENDPRAVARPHGGRYSCRTSPKRGRSWPSPSASLLPAAVARRTA